jgi:hypothetical protein
MNENISIRYEKISDNRYMVIRRKVKTGIEK